MVLGNYVEVAKVNEIPDGKMKHFEGREVLIANVARRFYAIIDRSDYTFNLSSNLNLN
jgi:hypothetical protein